MYHKAASFAATLAAGATLALSAGCGETKTVTETKTVAPATDPGPAAAPAAPAIGVSQETGGGAVAVVTKVKRGLTPTGSAAGAEDLRPGHEWAVATMRIKNEGTDVITDDTGSIFLLGPGSQIYRSSCCNQFPGELGNSAFSLAPGQSRAGVVVFQVPKRARLKAVGWEPADGGAPVTWTIKE